MMPQRTALLLACMIVWMVACEPGVPELVWVPGSDFSATLEVSIGDGTGVPLRVGEWIDLHATRSTGPWIQVASADLPEGSAWMREPPPALEPGVEANVKWTVEPGDVCRFNVPGTRDIQGRTIQCEASGTFRIWAESHTWGGESVVSDVVEIVVVDQGAD